MGTTLRQAINPVTLMDAVQQNDDALIREDGPLMKLAQQGQTGRCEGDEAVYDVWEHDKGMAPFNLRGVTATQAPNHTEDTKRVGMLSIVEEFPFKWETLAINRRKPTSSRESDGSLFNTDAQWRISTKLAEMVGRVRRRCENFVAGLLLTPTGVTVTKGTGPGAITETIAYNQPTYDIPTGKKWGQESTRIVSSNDQLLGIRNAMNANGRAPHRMIFDQEVSAALLGNTEVQNFARINGFKQEMNLLRDAFRPYDQERAMKGESAFDVASDNVFNGIGGIPYLQEWSHGYKQAGGSFTRFMKTEKGRAVVLPESLTDVFGYTEGKAAIPDVAASQIIGADQLEKVFKSEWGLVVYVYLQPGYPWNLILHVEKHFNFFITAPKKILTVQKILRD